MPQKTIKLIIFIVVIVFFKLEIKKMKKHLFYINKSKRLLKNNGINIKKKIVN